MNMENHNMLPGVEKKTNEYVERILKGEDKERVMRGLPPSFISAIEKKLPQEGVSDPRMIELPVSEAVYQISPEEKVLEKERKEKERLDKIEELRTLLGADQETSENSEKGIDRYDTLETMRRMIEDVGKTHYLFTHQTEESTARAIFESQFHVSPGTGISSTMTWLGAEGVMNQIERQLQGDAHRGYKGMYIAAIPKEVLDAVVTRNKADALGEFLMEHPSYGQTGSPDIYIPKEYNLGYLQGSVLAINKDFVHNENHQEDSKGMESISSRLQGLLRNLASFEAKRKEIYSQTEKQWYAGRRSPLNNQQHERMLEQSEERFWDWMNYQSDMSPNKIVDEYNNFINELSSKYELPQISQIRNEVFHSRTTFSVGEMQKYLERLQENIKNGLKQKQERASQLPRNYDTSWIQV